MQNVDKNYHMLKLFRKQHICGIQILFGMKHPDLEKQHVKNELKVITELHTSHSDVKTS
jgi:hypothetical protein